MMRSGGAPNFATRDRATSARAPRAALRMSVVEAPAPPKKGGLLARIGRALRDEVRVVRPRLVASTLLTAQLPQFAFPRFRTAVHRAAGLRIGARSVVLGPLVLTGSARIEELFSIGEQSQISGPLYADVGAGLRIGDRVYLGHHVTLLTIDHGSVPTSSGAARGAWVPSVSRTAFGSDRA